MGERQTGPTDREMKKLMGMKRTARWSRAAMIASIVLLFGFPILCSALRIDIPGLVFVALFLLMFLMLIVSEITKGRAQRQQAAMGVSRTPDELEADRKKAEKVSRLAASPEAVDRRLARLAGLNRFCQWNLRAGVAGMLLAAVAALIHQFVTELPMPLVVVLAIVTSIFIVVGVLGSLWVKKKQKDLSLHYTPKVLEAVLDRVDLYDHRGSVDHGYLWEDFSFPRREWVGPCGGHVKGVLKGMPIEFSEFCFQYETVERDKDGKTTREVHTSFSGMMVVCRHGFRLNNKVTLTQFSHFHHALGTESVDFNSAWSIREDAGQDAFYILTPHYMEKLMALSRDKWMKMGIQFRPDGTLLIVMQDVDFFEVDEAKSTEELKEKLKNELLDLADTMERIGAATLEEIAAQQEEGEGAT